MVSLVRPGKLVESTSISASSKGVFPSVPTKVVAEALSSLSGSVASSLAKRVDWQTPSGEPNVVFGEPDESSEESDGDEGPGVPSKAKTCAAAAAVAPNKTPQALAPLGKLNLSIATSRFPPSAPPAGEPDSVSDEETGAPFCAAAACAPSKTSRFSPSAPSADEIDFKESQPNCDQRIDQLCTKLNGLSLNTPLSDAEKDGLKELANDIEGAIFADPELGLRLKINPKIKEICQQISRVTCDESQCFKKARYNPLSSKTKAVLQAFGKKMERLVEFQPCRSKDDLLQLYVNEIQYSTDKAFQLKLLSTVSRLLPELTDSDSLPVINLEKIPKAIRKEAQKVVQLEKELLAQEFNTALKTQDQDRIWACFEKIKQSSLFSLEERDQFVSQIFAVTDCDDSEELYKYFCDIKPSEVPEVLNPAVAAVTRLYLERLTKAIEGDQPDEIAASFKKATGLRHIPFMTIQNLVNGLSPEQAWNPEIIEYVKGCGPQNWERHFHIFMGKLKKELDQYRLQRNAESLLLEVKKLIQTGLFDVEKLGEYIWHTENIFSCLLENQELFITCFPLSGAEKVEKLTRSFGFKFLDDCNPNDTDSPALVTKLRLRFHCVVDRNLKAQQARLNKEAS